jgi:membrane protein implicated in regulation of membrane protease activity
MECKDSVKAIISINREAKKNKHSFEDFLYLVMGDATGTSAVILLLAIIFYAASPVALFLVFGAYSGGMRWIITLVVITTLAIVAIYLMKKGLRRQEHRAGKSEAQMEFSGELSSLTEALERASMGYVYSQQLLRERLCEGILDKLGSARALSEDEMVDKLNSGETDFVGDDVLAKFLMKNRRGAEGWEETQHIAGKGKSKERGGKFMVEIKVILDLM